MAKSKEKSIAEFKSKRESERIKEIEEFVELEPATEINLEKFDNIEDYWRAMEKIQKIKKKELEEEKKRRVKEMLDKEEEDTKEKDPEKMTAAERFYWSISQKPKEPLQPSKSYKKD
jgi:hypothetical protein